MSRPYKAVTYDEAAELLGKSVEAVRQAAYRGSVTKTTEYRKGRERVGVRLDSLRKWLGWDDADYRDAARRLTVIRQRRAR